MSHPMQLQAAGSPMPLSHDVEEEFYKNVLDNQFFDLDRDGFHGLDNDLQVSVTSRLGGINGAFLNAKSNTLTTGSSKYDNTVPICHVYFRS
jgi:hypothetical protein